MATVNGKTGCFTYSDMDTGAVMHLFNTPKRAAMHFARICDTLYSQDTSTIEGGSVGVEKRIKAGEAVTGWFRAEDGKQHYRKVQFVAFLDAN